MRVASGRPMHQDPSKNACITPDVGGGFGTKVFPYREYPLALEAAKRLGKPVKWTSRPQRAFRCRRPWPGQCCHHAHGHGQKRQISGARGGPDCRHGRLSALHSALTFPVLGMTMTTGIYDIPAMPISHCRRSTPTPTPVDAYRGAGRPEAAYLIERLVDQCAMRSWASTPDEIRRRNFAQARSNCPTPPRWPHV